jgi:hypothetical protein
MAVLLVALALVVGQVARLRSSWGPGPHGAPGEAEWRAPATLQRDVALRLLILAAGAALALTWRFDLFPALLAIVAVWAALEHRPVVAGVAIGAGVLAKLFPIVLAPAIAVIWLAPLDWARLARFAWAAGITLVLGLAPFVALARGDALSFIGYQAARGLQVESVGGGLVLLLGLITGEPNRLVSPFSAWEVTGPVAEALLALSSAALVGGFLVLAALGWRLVRAEAEREGATSPATVVLLATAAILLLVLTSKVFSIQYVVWLLPFAALLPWRRFWLAAAAIALSIPIHPVLYEALVRQEALPILVLNLRNALLLALLAWVVWDLARSSPRPPAV